MGGTVSLGTFGRRTPYSGRVGGQRHDPDLTPDAQDRDVEEQPDEPVEPDDLGTEAGAGPDADLDRKEQSEAVERRTRRTWLIAAGVFVAMALVAGAAAYVVGAARSQGSSADRVESPVSQVPGNAPSASLENPASQEATPRAPYALTAEGMTSFLEAYRDRFETSEAVDLTLYDAYAIVDVPVPGEGEQQGWTYRDGLGWVRFGGPRPTVEGVAPIDTDRSEVGALEANLAEARRTLAVPNPTRASVQLLAPARAGASPTLEIHVSNDFDEEGVLTTALDGRVLRSTPYVAPEDDQTDP